jgi:hypothetical protein
MRANEVEKISDPEYFRALFDYLIARGKVGLQIDTPALDCALTALDHYIFTGNRAHLLTAVHCLRDEFANPSHVATHYKPNNDLTRDNLG